MKVRLYTREGNYVVTVEMPPFQFMPDAVEWGNRIFFRGPDAEYREGLCAHLWGSGTTELDVPAISKVSS